jgi:hypothetical protein
MDSLPNTTSVPPVPPVSIPVVIPVTMPVPKLGRSVAVPYKEVWGTDEGYPG